MFKMKGSFIAILLIVGLVATSMIAYAASGRYGIKISDPVETSTALVLPAGTWVYGIKIYADASNSMMALYDTATVAAALVGNAVDEIGEATQHDSKTVWYPKPKYFATGVTVNMVTGVGFIYYGPAPK